MANAPISFEDYKWSAHAPYNSPRLSPPVLEIVESLGVSRVLMQNDPRLPTNEYSQRSFEAVVSTGVIEHLQEPRKLPRYASAHLRPGGYLIVSTGYYGYLKNLLLSLLNKWDEHHSTPGALGPAWFWSRNTLEKLLREENFEVVGFRGVGRLPWLWSRMIIVARLVS